MREELAELKQTVSALVARSIKAKPNKINSEEKKKKTHSNMLEKAGAGQPTLTMQLQLIKKNATYAKQNYLTQLTRTLE